MLGEQVNVINLYSEIKEMAGHLDEIALCEQCNDKIYRFRWNGESLKEAFAKVYESTTGKSFKEFDARVLARGSGRLFNVNAWEKHIAISNGIRTASNTVEGLSKRAKKHKKMRDNRARMMRELCNSVMGEQSKQNTKELTKKQKEKAGQNGTMNVWNIYEGSDGKATKALYHKLETRGMIGVVAVNLFRAQKCSARAKVYRGGIKGKGSYSAMAYQRKNWSMENLCRVLGENADKLGMRYGWKRDDGTPGYEWLLYVDLPNGQVSFHSAVRLDGPDYLGEWDNKKKSAERIIIFCEKVLDGDTCNSTND
jgi:hypothetical protein